MTDHIPNVVVIPTRDHAETLCVNLVEQLNDQDEYDLLVVYDNRNIFSGNEIMTWPPAAIQEWQALEPVDTIRWEWAPGKNISQLWNAGWETAVKFGLGGPCNVHILNDDLVLPDGYIGKMAEKLRDGGWWLLSPDLGLEVADGDHSKYLDVQQVHGTYREGGITGCAFVLRAELLGDPLPPIDEQFRLWCSDDDLVKQIELHGGKVGIVKGLPIDHLGSQTVNLHPELDGWDDLKRFEEKYG